jgi:hypothetical protein
MNADASWTAAAHSVFIGVHPSFLSAFICVPFFSVFSMSSVVDLA